MLQDVSSIALQPAGSAALGALTRFYEAEARYSASGDLAGRRALLDTVHPDITLRQPESLSYGGVWRGREAFGQWLDCFVATWTEITPRDAEVHVCGTDLIVSTVTMVARARSTGAQIAIPMCQLIRFEDDLPIDWRNFAWDTAQMIKTLNGLV